MSAEKYKVLVVDDELPALATLQDVLQDYSHWQLIASCHSTQQARAILQYETIDLLLLDIEMPKQSGIEFARELSASSNPPIIVFITAYSKHAVEAFELFALDYLLKPFDDERFANMIARVETNISHRQILDQKAALQDYLIDRDAEVAGESPPTLSHIVVRSLGRIERIDVDDVIWIETAANYVEIHLQDRTILHRTTISSMEKHLSTAKFIRLHRRSIVKIDAICALEMGEDGIYSAQLTNGAKVRVNENSVRRVKQIFVN